jgi:hypothetical protein
MELEKHHLLRVQKYTKSAVRGEDASTISEDMCVTLGPLLTESVLDAAMEDARNGKFDDLDLDDELQRADAEVALVKAAEEADKKSEEDRILRDAREVMGLKVTTAVEEAEVTATEDEKKTGFWSRVGGFFKGLFVKSEESKQG